MNIKDDFSLFPPATQSREQNRTSQDPLNQRVEDIAQQHFQSEQIVDKLEKLLLSAKKADLLNQSEKIDSALESLKISRLDLIKALNNDHNIREGLRNIVAESFHSPWIESRQLKDMQLYLVLLSSHANQPEKENVTSLAEKKNLASLAEIIKETANAFLEITADPWSTHLEKIEKIVRELRESALREKSELLKKPSLLNTHKGIALNTKDFAHINAESIIKGSELEGNDPVAMISYLRNYLLVNKEKYESIEKCSQLIEMLEDAENFSKAGSFRLPVQGEFFDLSFNENFEERYVQFHNLFTQRLKGLNSGEKTLIDTGWISSTGGHSMKLGIEKNKNGTFCLTIYNMGEGLQYHPSLEEKGERLVQPFIKITDIKEERLIDKEFTQAFLELLTVSRHPILRAGSTEYNANDVYGLLTKTLGGTAVPCDGNRENFLPPQYSGTCAWASLSAVLFENLTLKDYYRINCDINLDSICSYYQANKSTLSENGQNRILLEHASINLAQQALNAFENEAISIERLHEIYATLNELKVGLDRANWDSSQKQSNLESITFENLEPRNKNFYSFETLESELKFDLKKLDEDIKVEENKEFFVNLNEWINNPFDFSTEIDRLFHDISANIDKKEGVRALEIFFKQLASIKDENFWNKIPSEDVQGLFVNFANLSELLFKALKMHPEKFRSYGIYSLHIYALMFLLGKKHPEFQIYKNAKLCDLYRNAILGTYNDPLKTDFNLYSPEERSLCLRSLEILKNDEFTAPYHKFCLTERSAEFMSIRAPLNNEEYESYDLKYIADYLKKNPSIKERLIIDYPQFNKELEISNFQVALLACDWHGRYLPPHFCAFRRQNIIAEALFVNSSIERMGLESDKEEIFKTTPTIQRGNASLKQDFDVKRNPDSVALRDFKSKNRFNELIRNRDHIYGTRLAYTSEKDIVLSNKSEFEKNLALIDCHGDVDNTVQHLEQQVTKTLAYFIDHFTLLEEHDIRMFCRYLLFEGDYLEKILQLNPSFESILSNFVIRGMQYFEEKEEIEGVDFFIELGINLKEFFKFNDFPDHFPNFREKIIKLLSLREWDSKEKVLLHRQLIASYVTDRPEKLSKEDVKQLLISLLYIKTDLSGQNLETQYIREQIDEAYVIFQKEIKSMLLSEQGNEICNAILAAFSPTSDSKQKWNCIDSYPLCTSADEKILFDAKNVELYIEGSSLCGLPKNVLEDSNYKKIFSGKNYHCKRINANLYEFIDDRGYETRIVAKVYSETIFQKLEDGRWYKYDGYSWLSNESPRSMCIRDSSLKTISSINYKKYDSELNAGLTEKERAEVMEFLFSDVEPSMIRFRIISMIEWSKLINRVSGHLQLNEENSKKFASVTEKLMKADDEKWNKMSEGERRRQDRYLNKIIKEYLSAAPTSNLMANLQSILKLIEIDNRIKEIFLIENCCKNPFSDNPLYLVDLKNVANLPISHLLKDAMLWKDGEGNLRELEIPSLDLFFKMEKKDGSMRAYSAEYPGYYLASNQQYRGLKPISGSIVLENDKGQRKLIVPYGKVVPESGSLTDQLRIEKSNQITKISIAFDLDATSKPKPKNKEEKLYLANILFAQKKYGEAQQLLKGSFSNVMSYKAAEKLLIENIKDIAMKSGDDSPHATALLLTAFFILPLDPHQKIEEEISENILRRYQSYRKLKSTIPSIALSEEEEKKALLNLRIPYRGLERGLNESTIKVSPVVEKTKIKKDPFRSFQKTSLHTMGLGWKGSEKDRIKAENNQLNHLNSIVTRMLSPDFIEMCSLAKNDPLKLELYLLGANKEASIPKEFITLWRAISHDFDPENIEDLFKSEKVSEFKKIAEKAEKFENNWQKELPQSSRISATGELPKRRRTEKEALSIGKRASSDLEIAALPLLRKYPFLSDDQLKNFFKPIENQGLTFSSNELKTLQSSISERGEKPLPSESEALSGHIETFWNLPLHKDKWHLLESDNIGKIKTLLLVEKSELGKFSNLHLQELLDFANCLPDLEKTILFELEKSGRMREEITLKDLALFVAKSRHFSLEGKNPELKERETELFNKCLRYFDLKAQHQQLHRAINIIDDLEKVKGKDYLRISEKLHKELTRKVPYEAHKYPELLIFEVLQEKGIYEWQVSDLKRMLAPPEGESSNIILEKVMGSGKTKVYLPLLALSNADGDHLSMIVVHSSQYETVAQALHTESGQMFDQVAHTLSFSRDSDSSLPALTKILEEMEKVRKEKHFYIITDKSMHSLGLAFDELWILYLQNDQEDPDIVARIEVMQKILNLIKGKGKAIFDEADLLLNCRDEVVYSLGDAHSIYSDHANIVADLFKVIDPILGKIEVFTLEEYDQIKPTLISAFLDSMKDSGLDLDLLAAYFNDEERGNQYLASLPEKERNLLAIVHYQFKELLPIVLNKRCGVHYGYSDDPNKILSVPYLASGIPSPTSEFSFPYALLDYTMQTLKYQGVSLNLLKKIIEDLQVRSEKELKANPMLPLQKTQAYQEFVKLCGLGLSLPFLKIRDHEIKKIAENYQKHPELKYDFAKKYLFPAATIHPQKITSTPYTLQKMFCQVQGFTGTPWNNKTYSNELTTLRDPLSAGKTQGIIWKNSEKVYSLKSEKFEDEIAEILKKGKHSALIDVGALYNGIENQKVAEELLKQLPEKFNGVLFYKNNLPHVMERGKSEPIPYEKYESTRSLFIFYDQWHTTGTDYVIEEKSLLTVGKNTKMRDLEQGYMRDRQAEIGKRVDFLAPTETQKFLRVELGLKADAEIKTADLLRGAEIVQERELNDQILMATFGKIKEVVHSHLRILQLSDKGKLREKRLDILKLLSDKIVDFPWEQFGKLQVEIDTKDFFAKVIDLTIESMDSLINESLTKEALEKELWACVDLTSLPNKMSEASKFAPEQLVEKESLAQVQQERMALVQKELLSDLVKSNNLGAAHWSWNPEASTSKRDFYVVKDVTSVNRINLPEIEKTAEGNFPIYKNQTPIFKISDIFKNSKLVGFYQVYADIFDIEVSYNFLPILDTIPFSKGQLDVKNMLLCRDRETGEVQLRLISNADTGYFYEKLERDRKNEGTLEIDVALYNIKLGIIQSNNQEILNKKDDIIDDQVKRKIIQAKFYNGESLYTEEEIPLLKEWIQEKGVERMKTLFLEKILIYKNEKRKEFPESPLERIFT